MWQKTTFAIIALAAALLVVVVADDAESTPATNNNAVELLCKRTVFPKTCIVTLSKAENSSNTRTLMKAAFLRIIEQAEYSIKHANASMDGTCHGDLLYAIDEAKLAIGVIDSAGSKTDFQSYVSHIHDGLKRCTASVADQADGAAELKKLLKLAQKLTFNGVYWGSIFPELMKPDDPVTNSASQKAIQELCQKTTYKQLCVDSLSKATNSSDTRTLILVSLQEITKEIKDRFNNVSDVVGNYKSPCPYFMQMSVEALGKAAKAMNSIELNAEHMKFLKDNFKVFISGARTALRTCVATFELTDNEEMINKMSEFIRVPNELLQNALEWSADFDELMKNYTEK